MIKPANNRFIENIQELGSRLNQLERATQPQLVGWYSYAPSDFIAEPSDDSLTVPAALISQFNIGAKVRLKQDDTIENYRYFYITGKDELTNKIYLYAGVDYAIDAFDLLEVAVSELQNPDGHPYYFQGAIVPEAVNVGRTFTNDSEFVSFYMTGKTVHLEIQINGGSLSGGASDLYIDLPVPVENLAAALRRPAVITNDFTVETGYLQILGNQVTFGPLSGGFANSTQGITADLDIQYIAGSYFNFF